MSRFAQDPTAIDRLNFVHSASSSYPLRLALSLESKEVPVTMPRFNFSLCGFHWL